MEDNVLDKISMKKTETFKRLFFLHFEWVALAAGLILMALLDPAEPAASFCPIDRIGLQFCPGEGLGKSIAFAFRGDLTASVASHPAGIAAIFIMTGRITSILHRNYKINHTNTEL